MYDVYLDKMLCPIAPGKIETKINNKNKTVTLINEGEVNLLKKAGLTEISFDLLLPNKEYPFAVYKSGFRPAKYYMEQLERLKTSQSPFKFKVIRMFPDGEILFSTNIKVALENYTVTDDAKDGFDITVNVNLKQYKYYGTKTCNIQFASTKPKIPPPAPPRPAPNPPAPNNRTYTVKSGDCLWKIAKMFYGNGGLWQRIYNANAGVCGKPYKKGGTTYVMIHPGDVLTIP